MLRVCLYCINIKTDCQAVRLIYSRKLPHRLIGQQKDLQSNLPVSLLNHLSLGQWIDCYPYLRSRLKQSSVRDLFVWASLAGATVLLGLADSCAVPSESLNLSASPCFLSLTSVMSSERTEEEVKQTDLEAWKGSYDTNLGEWSREPACVSPESSMYWNFFIILVADGH